MKAWEKLYKSEDLDEAIVLVQKVSVKSNDGFQIIAQVDDYEVETFIEYGSPTYPSCNCTSRYPCRHEAAFTYYLKSHPELYLKGPDFDEVFNMVSEDNLRDFLLAELEQNPSLKDRFLKKFADNTIDKDYYTSKLNNVFKKGEGRDFRYHGFS